jgi:methionyl-tRNA synthetase
MIAKNCDGQIPTPGALTEADEAILKTADDAIAICREEMGKQQIHKAVAAIINIVNEADRYFAAQAPWVLKKTDEARMGTVLYVTAEVVRQIAVLFQPIMPGSAAKLLDLVAVAEEDRVFSKLGAAGRLVPGTVLEAPSPVFPRYVAPEADKA